MSGSFPRTHLVSVEAADEPRESQRTSSILISVALMHSCSRIMSAFPGPIFVAVRDVQIEVKEQYRAGIRRLTEEAKGSCAEAKDEVRARLGSMEVEGIGIGRDSSGFKLGCRADWASPSHWQVGGLLQVAD